jgi:hypothetical protein
MRNLYQNRRPCQASAVPLSVLYIVSIHGVEIYRADINSPLQMAGVRLLSWNDGARIDRIDALPAAVKAVPAPALAPEPLSFDFVSTPVPVTRG